MTARARAHECYHVIEVAYDGTTGTWVMLQVSGAVEAGLIRRYVSVVM